MSAPSSPLKHRQDLLAHLQSWALRFDVGSGMATIRDPNPVKLGEFHTVELYRNHTLGYIVVDGGEPINGSSQVQRTAELTLSRLLRKHTFAVLRASSRGWI